MFDWSFGEQSGVLIPLKKGAVSDRQKVSTLRNHSNHVTVHFFLKSFCLRGYDMIVDTYSVMVQNSKSNRLPLVDWMVTYPMSYPPTTFKCDLVWEKCLFYCKLRISRWDHPEYAVGPLIHDRGPPNRQRRRHKEEKTMWPWRQRL